MEITMGKDDYKYKPTLNEESTINNDIVSASIILSALIRSGTTKTAASREAVMLLKELKKCYQENLGSD